MVCDVKKNIFIHVGYPKTATTTLQKHFFPKIKEIQYIGKFDNSENIYHFGAELINELIFNKNEKINNTNLLELFGFNLENKIVLSEESFLSNCLRMSNINGRDLLPNVNDIANNIRRLFVDENFNVKIIFTIRKQDEMITSQYAQSYVHYYSKYKETDTFSKFLKIYTDKKFIGHSYFKALDYFQTINYYSCVFGEDNVKVLLFEELQKKPELFYQKLCDFLKVDSCKYKRIAINKNENKRESNYGHKITKCSSLLDKLSIVRFRYFSFMKIHVSKNLKSKLKKIVWSNNNKISESIYLTEIEKEKVLNSYKKSNERLSESMNLNLKEYGYYND